MKEPKIRFQESEGVWKNVYFSEIAERISVSGQAGTLPGIEFEDIISGEGRLNKDVYQKECFKYGKLFNKGDVLFGKLRPYLKNIILADFRGVAIGDFWVLRSKENNSKFLYTMVLSEAFMKVANISSGSKMPRADWNLVSATRFNIPINKKEQQYIGKYFSIFDTQISTASSRLASLKQVKEASLQAMFPQKGETVPKIRFKGFEGEWTKVKLNDICFKKASNLSESSLGIDTGQYAVYGASGYLQNISTFDIPSEYVGIIKDGSGVGRTKVYPAFTSILGTMQYILAKEDNNIRFIAALFENIDFSTFISGSGIPHIYFRDYGEIYVMIPSLVEQQAIASYFTSLDKQIALQTQRLEKLRQIKAACLDKMFV